MDHPNELNEDRDRRLSLPLNDTELPRISIGPVAPEQRKFRRHALTGLVLFSAFTIAWIAAPLWVGIAIGTMMAFTAQPIYRRLSGKIHSRAWAAALVSATTGIVGAAALSSAAYVITNEIFQIVGNLQGKLAKGSTLEALIGETNARLVDHMGLRRAEVMEKLRHEIASGIEYATRAVGVILETTTGATLGFIIALMTMYYVLLEWAHIAVKLERLLPLDPRHTRALILEFRDVGRSSFVGTIATALVQGFLAGVGYGITGVPQFVTYALLTAIASFVPIVGTMAVFLPIAIYLAVTDHLLAAVFVTIWGILVVQILADYVIRPRLVGRRGDGHPLLMLIALLGGIEVFGLAGLFVGPVLMSLFLAALRIYERELEIEAALEPTPPRRRSTDTTRTGPLPEPPPTTTKTPSPSSSTPTVIPGGG